MELSSVMTGDNADLIYAVAEFYIKNDAIVADVTFGKGAFWRKTDIERFTLLASDLEPNGIQIKKIDFCDLPYEDASIDVVVLDPPYVHNPGKHITDSRYNNAATTRGLYHNDILELYYAGIREAIRVLKPQGQLWVKCKDEIESGRQRWSHIEIWQEATRLGLYDKDLFILIPDSKTSANRWVKQLHARKRHSYLWVFVKDAKVSNIRLAKQT
jgi:methylase of polypeptide subunit release factors